MATPKADAARFSIGQARAIVKDLFEPNPLIYWADFLTSLSVGVAAFLGCYFASFVLGSRWHGWLWPVSAVLYVVSCLALYRAVLFIHELTHLRRGTFEMFRVAWNLMVGIPMLLPSFLYYTHVSHHARKHYGTDGDGEYVPWAVSPTWQILFYLSQSLVIPLLAVVRFGILAPITWISPRVRSVVARHASSLVVDPAYLRPLPSKAEWRLWQLQEIGCFISLVALAAVIASGIGSPTILLYIYVTAVGGVTLNAIRTLGAHRYRNPGDEMSHLEQLLDSVNYPRHPLLSELWAPVGLRFHALHHLFPSLPYHNLGAAHRRLMEQLPSDSPYRRTESPGLLATLGDLWRSARAASQQQPDGTQGNQHVPGGNPPIQHQTTQVFAHDSFRDEWSGNEQAHGGDDQAALAVDRFTSHEHQRQKENDKMRLAAHGAEEEH
jgi:fatty acid desaturase